MNHEALNESCDRIALALGLLAGLPGLILMVVFA